MHHVRSIMPLAVLALLGASSTPEPAPKLVVLTIDLNNIHKSAPEPNLAGRVGGGRRSVHEIGILCFRRHWKMVPA